MDFERIEEVLGRILEGTGVAIIVIDAVLATATFVLSARRAASIGGPYRSYRRSLARAILLGLEFLVAGDFVRTVAIDSTFRSVGILAIIIAIRTFLSI